MSKRWIKTSITAADECETKLPWTRGARRQEMISRRLERDRTPARITLPPLPEGMCLPG